MSNAVLATIISATSSISTAAVVVESTMPLRKVEEVAVSPPNEFDPGIGAGATTSLPRPQVSTCEKQF